MAGWRYSFGGAQHPRPVIANKETRLRGLPIQGSRDVADKTMMFEPIEELLYLDDLGPQDYREVICTQQGMVAQPLQDPLLGGVAEG